MKWIYDEIQVHVNLILYIKFIFYRIRNRAKNLLHLVEKDEYL